MNKLAWLNGFFLALFLVILVVNCVILPSSGGGKEQLADVLYMEGEIKKLTRVLEPKKVKDVDWEKAVLIKSDDPLEENDYLWVQNASLLVIRFKDASTARVGPDSKLLIKRLATAQSGSIITRLRLELGKVWLQVTKVLEGGAYEVEAWDIVAAVKGTEFAVEIEDEDIEDEDIEDKKEDIENKKEYEKENREYLLDVYEGKVRVTQEGAPESVDVENNFLLKAKLREKISRKLMARQGKIKVWHEWNNELSKRIKQQDPSILRDRKKIKLILRSFKRHNPQLWEWLKKHPHARQKFMRNMKRSLNQLRVHSDAYNDSRQNNDLQTGWFTKEDKKSCISDCSKGNRKKDCKSASFTYAALDCNFSVVHFHNLFCNGKSQAAPAELSG